MKIPVYIIALLVILTSSALTQDEPPSEGQHRERLEQLRRIKLIETLELNEEQAVRLSVREKEFRAKEKEMLDRRRAMAEELRTLIDENAGDDALRAQLARLDEIGAQIVHAKHAFLLSLNDFLTMRQIAGIVLFEQKFALEVRRLLKNARRPQRR
jgi:hypothetical protein